MGTLDDKQSSGVGADVMQEGWATVLILNCSQAMEVRTIVIITITLWPKQKNSSVYNCWRCTIQFNYDGSLVAKSNR